MQKLQKLQVPHANPGLREAAMARSVHSSMSWYVSVDSPKRLPPEVCYRLVRLLEEEVSEPNLIVANLSSFRAAQILLKVGELGRGPRSCPFATLIGASERARKVGQNAPTSVSNGHDLTLLLSSPTLSKI